MSVLCVVAVWDSAAQAFGRPLFVPSVGVALRSFTDEVNRKAPDNAMNQHYADFELYELCSFNEEAGEFFDPVKRMVARGKDVFNLEV